MQKFGSIACALAMLYLTPPHALPAQGASVPKSVTSCGATALILVTVVNAAGTPVGDATIQVRRARDGKVVREAEADLPNTGEYVVMDDLLLPMVEKKGTRFIVQVRRAKQRASVVLRIGRTDDGCHVRRISGATRLTLR